MERNRNRSTYYEVQEALGNIPDPNNFSQIMKAGYYSRVDASDKRARSKNGIRAQERHFERDWSK